MSRLLAIFLISLFCLMGCGKKSAPTLKPYEPPKAVSDFSAIRLEDSIILSWDYPVREREGLEGFIIQRSHDKKTSNIKVSAETNQYIDTDIKERETYRYRIYGINKRGIAGIPSVDIEAKVCPLPEGKISIRHKIYDNYIEISWEKPVIKTVDSDCNLMVSYNIYKSYSLDKPSSTPINPQPLQDTSFKIGVEAEDISYYHIRPIFKGQITHIGIPSNTLTISSKDLIPSKPKILNYTSTQDRIFITWKEASESWVIGYKIYKMMTDGTFSEIAFVTTPIFTELATESSQSYKITSVGPKIEGPASDIITIKR
ncbi:MAG: fibronectin type III domain-containing protein [Thermodesulfovibrionales bacterium]